LDKKEWNGLNEAELGKLALEVLTMLGNNKVLLLEGDLGTGKTTLVKELCKRLNVKDPVNSPTYSIVNEYKFDEDKTVFHFDLYRLEQEELYDLGFEEYLSSGDYVFVEWPELAMEFVPEESMILRISMNETGRTYQLTSINN